MLWSVGGILTLCLFIRKIHQKTQNQNVDKMSYIKSISHVWIILFVAPRHFCFIPYHYLWVVTVDTGPGATCSSDSHILQLIKSMSPFGHQLNGIVNSGASLPTERFCHDTHLSDAMLRTFFRPAVRKTTAVTGREAFGSCYDICQTKKNQGDEARHVSALQRHCQYTVRKALKT